MDPDEGANATDSCRAVRNDGLFPACARPEIVCNLDEVNDLLGISGNAEIWPARVMQVRDIAVLGPVAYPKKAALNVVERGLVDQLDGKHSKHDLLAEVGRPVDIGLAYTILGEPREHNDDAGALLPHHAPKVSKG
eukprot:Mycagemm_TRINITY_DN10038_c0_g1::TRINITY_DN10038_c0_g1_i1::g.2017::m.2017 type:complete len:136 gc:universal TRINITY_DN10038_c0_g1_i1:885-478(-)